MAVFRFASKWLGLQATQAVVQSAPQTHPRRQEGEVGHRPHLRAGNPAEAVIADIQENVRSILKGNVSGTHRIADQGEHHHPHHRHNCRVVKDAAMTASAATPQQQAIPLPVATADAKTQLVLPVKQFPALIVIVGSQIAPVGKRAARQWGFAATARVPSSISATPETSVFREEQKPTAQVH
jgi:hypothetical protein